MIYSPTWEVRHGAAVGLKGILATQAQFAGTVATVIATLDNVRTVIGHDTIASLSADEITKITHTLNHTRNQVWLQDLAIRLLCVLALDRFSDFLGDRVVVLVRESCAQVLGVVVKALDADTVKTILTQGLLVLCSGAEPMPDDQHRAGWALKYSGAIGIKHLLASRTDLLADLVHHTALVATLHTKYDSAFASCLIIVVYRMPMTIFAECRPKHLCLSPGNWWIFCVKINSFLSWRRCGMVYSTLTTCHQAPRA